ncbi:MAG: rhodanese-like domain-containing protein [Vicinamibacterales bacterium]
MTASPLPPPRLIDHPEAVRLVAEGAVTVVDVRTPQEHARLGHIPGARLLPVDVVAAGPAVLPDDGRPLLVYCEHGVRSRVAAAVLAAAGTAPVLELRGGLAGWRGPREFGPGRVEGPAAWLLENADLLRPRMRVLDVAAGRGRHALLFAAAGCPVTAVDRDAAAMARLDRIAAAMGHPVTTAVVDLEAGAVDFGIGAYDLVVVTHYLHRPLMPALVAAVAPGGMLVYETFTTAQAARGKPTNPAYLLQPGELPTLVAPLVVARSREGVYDDREVAAVVAVRR